MKDYSVLTGRILMSAIFIMAGLNKIVGYDGTQAYMDSVGVPGMLLPLVILLEVLGGLCILLGFKTQLAAWALAGFSVVSAVLFHFHPEEQIQMIMLMKNFAMAGGFLFLAAYGAGTISLDEKFS